MMKRFARVARLSVLCIFTLLFSYATAYAVPVADSVSEFSSVQGQDDWYYGYYTTPGDYTTFTPMSLFDSTGWTEWWEESSTQPPWTLLWDTGGHPGSSHWAVRRWVSETTGTVTISGLLQDNDPGVSGGVVGRILVDGVEVFSQVVDAYPGSTYGPPSVNYSITVPVSLGAYVDFAIDANGYEGYDNTTFTATIDAAVTPVPEPATLLLLGSGLAGVAVLRRRFKN